MAHNTKVSADADAPPVTQILADFVAGHPSQGWDASVDKEAHRTLLNWVGCAIGASHHPTVKAALAAVMELAPNAQATILGRRERVDVASAAMLNGITSHTFDFDDTHLRTIIHPAGPVASALLALAEQPGRPGCSVRLPHARDCSDSTRARPQWRWASPRRSPLACASSSDR